MTASQLHRRVNNCVMGSSVYYQASVYIITNRCSLPFLSFYLYKCVAALGGAGLAWGPGLCALHGGPAQAVARQQP